MSLVKPIAQPKNAFDAETASIFYFTSVGGNQVVKNRLTIRNNITNVVVYQNTVETFLYQQEVPLSTLTNGTYYNFYFNTYDSDDNISPDSNAVSFYCYTQPTLVFTNAPSSNTIEASSYTFDATYDQVEDELLNYLVFTLYDSNGVELSNSGNLYSSLNPPISFSHLFSGFNDNTTYKVQVKAISINGTETYSELYTFLARYSTPNIFSLIDVESNCNGGYNQIRSNVILSEGSVSPEPPLFRSKIVGYDPDDYIQWNEWYVPVDDVISIWTQRYALELTDLSKTLTFNDGFSIPSNFQYQRWLKPSTDGIIEYMYKTGNESNRMIVELKSGIPSGESTVKNWFELYTEDGNLFDYSNYVDAMKIDTDFIIWFKKVGTTYTLLLDVVNVGTGSTVSWAGTATYPTAKIHNNIDSLFPFDVLKLRNGVFDNLDMTSNTDRVYSQSFPIWDYYTKINCDFSTLMAGNINLVLAQLESIKIKRRLSGTFNWITLKTIPISSADDLNITLNDCGTPTGKTFDYAIVPVLSGGIEGDYIVANLTTSYRWCYLCDGNTILTFYSNVSYPSITSNINGGLFLPIGSKYPITVYNSENDYENGTFGGNILGGNFLTTRQINRADVQSQLATYKAMINNKAPKFLKDWDGRIKVVDTNIGSGLTEAVDLVSGKAQLNFSWVEKGDWNTQQDLYDNGLVDDLT